VGQRGRVKRKSQAARVSSTPPIHYNPHMIRDVHHIGIAVRSLEAATALFHEALGLPIVKEAAVPARGVRGAMLAAGASYLEILEPTEDSSPFAQHIAERGEGLHHLALWSDDVDADVARLRDLAVPLADREPRTGFTGRLSYLTPQAFDGAQLEVVQPEPGLGGNPDVSPSGTTPRPAHPEPVEGRADGPEPTPRPAHPEPVEGRAEHNATHSASHITRIDHVVLRVPSVPAVTQRFESYFGVQTKRTMDRGGHEFAFLRPGDVVIEVIGPKEGGEPNTGRLAGLAFAVTGIDELTASLKRQGYPIGQPHAALQGGRIVSIHHTGACGVPLAFIDFTDSSR
jgi:methylmalonyl-CoA/ethylmalonyl-CoA epimerase